MKYAILGLSLLSPFAQAHYGMLECWFADEKAAVVCQAGWSDGTDASNYDIELFDYDDNLLARARTDAKSQVRFETPEDEFYLIFDPGHEAPAEVDVVEIKEK
ncbi:hypothetical protein C9I98_19155 [Photobacterium sanctipauli]|uniref:Uncharacterized protein n=1 Tax=Photobacterium sanctipauli TaxID=1342794 RepID=A0A2T3NNV5_9GAMM|nr:hypothetical protein [Photobacterium sanctipauli]PSW17636.1 hypothetical protein C9I98_19155 [Photobacterium sanctipauli]